MVGAYHGVPFKRNDSESMVRGTGDLNQDVLLLGKTFYRTGRTTGDAADIETFPTS